MHRWLKGRRPHARNRWAVSGLLDENEAYLWPPEGLAVTGEAATAEVLGAYAHRAAVPVSAWWQLFTGAEVHVDLLGYAMLHLPEQHPQLMEVLGEMGRRGDTVRVAFADPECREVAARDAEEQLSGTLSARIRTATNYFRELQGAQGLELRQHATPLYNSIFRFDDQLYVTPHLFGIPGPKAPLFHLRRRGPTGVFERFVTHFEAIWATTRPLERAI